MTKKEYKIFCILTCLFLMPTILFFAFSCSGCSIFKKYPHDNPVEELTEEIIEMKTGIDLDLSWTSPESESNQESEG